MNKTKSVFSLLATFLFVITCTTVGQAQSQRTFVAGPGIGDDANVGSGCTFTLPCRFFQTAFGVTNTGGEIIALTPGVGYGGMTITKAITVTGLPGQVAFIAIPASSTGITVSAGVSELVMVKNLSFNGSNAASSTGLRHNSGRLVVKDCVFTQLTIGVNNFAKMDLVDCDLHGNGTALQSTGQGTYLQSDISVAQLRVNGGNVTANTVGTHQVNAGVNGMMNPLSNIWAFALGGGTLNLVGNVTNSTCAGAGCQPQIGTYTMSNALN